ncbi:MAG: efflux RND transporter periplasmic adaptor subunit [Ectothiorhodospiraceae bacterium]|nr:efflux RND transporter periplasmic adaptor subunit [Ectothiorhodospiraceae bacterium]
MRRGVVVAVAMVVALGAAAAVWWRAREPAAPDTALALYGTVDVREIHLTFQAVGQVASVLVEEGEPVAAGQVLATQDAALLRAQEAAAVAEVAARRAALDRLEAGSRSEEVRKARADVAAAEASLRDAESTARRVDRLAATGAVERQRVDDTLAAADTARARLDALRAALDLTLAGPRAEDIDEARAVLARAEAELRLVRERLDDTTIRAPLPGVVRERVLQPGDLASPERPVLVLALTDPLWVRAFAPEPALGRLREGTAVEIETDSFADKRYAGWVGSVSPTAEFTPKSVHTEALRTSLVYQVRVIVCNPAGELRLGMPVTVRLGVEPGAATAVAPGERCAGDGRR